MGHHEADLVKRIATCNYSFDEEKWRGVSAEAKDWIKGLLKLNPGERMNPEAALSHKWLSSPESA